MEILQVTKDNALQAYKDGDDDQKSLLSKLFGKKHFFSDMTEMIDSFEAACDYNNTNPRDPRFTNGTPSGNAMEMIAEIAKALNGGKVMKGGEYRWYPWFEYATSGFRFRVSYYSYTSAFSCGGPRLCLLNEKLSNYMGKQFLPLYDTFLNG